MARFKSMEAIAGVTIQGDLSAFAGVNILV